MRNFCKTPSRLPTSAGIEPVTLGPTVWHAFAAPSALEIRQLTSGEVIGRRRVAARVHLLLAHFRRYGKVFFIKMIYSSSSTCWYRSSSCQMAGS